MAFDDFVGISEIWGFLFPPTSVASPAVEWRCFGEQAEESFHDFVGITGRTRAPRENRRDDQ